jgi:hypothetical protein
LAPFVLPAGIFVSYSGGILGPCFLLGRSLSRNQYGGSVRNMFSDTL